MEKVKDNKIGIMLSVIFVALFIVVAVMGTYAFYSATFDTTGNNGISGKASDLKLKFTNNTDELNLTNLIPGESDSKSFTVQNAGTVAITFKVVVKEVNNDFSKKDDLTYDLKENDKSIKTGPFPSTTAALSDIITIPAGETRSYVLTVTYENTEEPQNEDMGKKVSCQIFIDDTVE